LSKSVKQSVYQTVVVEAGAAGLASLVAASILDVTGVVPVAVLATAGLLWLPYKRNQVNKEFQQGIATLKSSLVSSLRGHFDAELAEGIARVRESVSEFDSFVDKETATVTAIEERFADTQSRIDKLRVDIDNSFASKD
jgi:hypothetical protein